MVMLRDELMAEVGGGMEEDREAAAVAIPAPVAEGTAQSARIFLHIFACDSSSFVFHGTQICFYMYVFVLVLYLFIVLGAMRSRVFRVQSAVRGHGTARR